MDAIKTKGLFRTSRAWLALWPFITFAMPMAEASPIRWQPRPRPVAQSIGLARQVSASPSAWGAFLAGGETAWSTQEAPAYTAAVRQAVVRLIQSDPEIAASSPLLQYFVWRRNLNAARFDAYHPFIGPNLPHTLIPPTPSVVPPLTPPAPSVIPPPDPLTPPVPSVIPPPTVPEPSALLVILAGVIGALTVRRRRESRASE